MVDSRAEREGGKTEEGGGRTFPLRNFGGGRKEGRKFWSEKEKRGKRYEIEKCDMACGILFSCNISVAAVAF